MGIFSSKENNPQQPKTHEISCYQRCFKVGGFEVRVNSVLEALPLTFEQKRIIRKRLVKQVVNLEEDSKKVTWRYNFCRIVIGIGSMALPSLPTMCATMFFPNQPMPVMPGSSPARSSVSATRRPGWHG